MRVERVPPVDLEVDALGRSRDDEDVQAAVDDRHADRVDPRQVVVTHGRQQAPAATPAVDEPARLRREVGRGFCECAPGRHGSSDRSRGRFRFEADPRPIRSRRPSNGTPAVPYCRGPDHMGGHRGAVRPAARPAPRLSTRPDPARRLRRLLGDDAGRCPRVTRSTRPSSRSTTTWPSSTRSTSRSAASAARRSGAGSTCPRRARDRCPASWSSSATAAAAACPRTDLLGDRRATPHLMMDTRGQGSSWFSRRDARPGRRRRPGAARAS